MRIVVPILLAFVLIVGCAGTARTTRVADVANGDYYTNKEIKGLSQAERDRYCAVLDAEILRIRAEAAVFDASADSLGQLGDSLKVLNTHLATRIRDLDGEIRQLRLARRAAATYVVKAGDTLQGIASVVYGSSDQWRDIYDANKSQVGSPTAPLKPGTKLTIPGR